MKRVKMKRKGERWVSNNRVLLGASKKDPGRNPNFDTDETKLLISLWGDPVVQKTLITTHRKHNVIVKLAEKMGEYGYSRSAEEINTRIKNLKCFYNRLKKDIVLGLINEATWKHFNAMDEIMTRSIFSVRPNEIPKPSLKYQMELEQTELEEKRKLKVKRKSSNHSAHISEENISNSSIASEDDAIEEQMNCDDGFVQYSESEGNPVKIKEEHCSNSYDKDVEEADEGSLIVPKDEPLDDDDDDVQFVTPDLITDVKTIPECMTPKLSDYMQMSTGNSNTMTVTSNCHKMSATNPNTILRAALSPTVNTSINGIPQSIVFANQPNAMSGAGKISIVPTNFLMHQNKGMPQQIQIRQQPQQRIICSQQNTQSNTGIVTSAGDGRMKVLLVNAFQNGKTTTAVTTKETTYSNTNLITTANILKTNTTEAGVHKPIIETVKQTRTDEAGTSKDPGMELLFNRLIVMQSENNEIQRQRLEIERQRLEFEKSMAEKLLAALSSLNKVQKPENGTITTPRETSTSIKESAPPDIIEEFNGFPLLTPKLEKMD